VVNVPTKYAITALVLMLAATSPAVAGDGLSFQRESESPRTLSKPHDIVLSRSGRYLLAADLGNDAIQVLDPLTLKIVSSFGKDILNSPHDVAVARDGRVLVADTANNRIAVFRFMGVGAHGKSRVSLLASWSDGIDWPEGVDAGPDGRVYVGNVGSHSVAILKDGRVVKRVGGPGNLPLEFSRPHDVEVTADGRVIVVDSGNNRLQILDLDLNLVKVLAGAPYNFHEPKYVALDTEGRLYVADEYNSQVKIFDRDYAPVAFIGSGQQGDGPGQLNWPEGVFVDGTRIWISDTYNDRILRYRR